MSMNKLHISISSLLFVCAFSLMCPPAALSDPMLGHTYDWIAEIETQQLDKTLNFQGVGQQPVVRAHVSYFKNDKPEQTTDYENLWYSNGKPLGLQRLNPLNITQGEQIAIRIKHKKNSAPHNEKVSAANAALRVLLDSMLNRNLVAAVLVPQNSFSEISQSLQDQNCVPGSMGEGQQMSNVDIFLKSEPNGPTQMLHYLK